MNIERIARERFGTDVATLRTAMRIADALHAGQRPSEARWARDFLTQQYGPDAVEMLRRIEDIADPVERVREYARGVSDDDTVADAGLALWQEVTTVRTAAEIEERRSAAEPADDGPKLSPHVERQRDDAADLRASLERSARRFDPGFIRPDIHGTVQAFQRLDAGLDPYPESPVDQPGTDLRRTIAAAFDTEVAERIESELE